jgi:hypothetical protein
MTTTTPPANAWDLALDPATQDLMLDDEGDLILVDGAELAQQSIRMVLLTHAGEWWADVTLGIDWRGEVLVKNPRLDLVRALLSEQILTVPGVRAVGDIIIDVEPATRAATITITATATAGELLQGEIAL